MQVLTIFLWLSAPYGIFARSCVAMAKDSKSTFPIIDDEGYVFIQLPFLYIYYEFEYILMTVCKFKMPVGPIDLPSVHTRRQCPSISIRSIQIHRILRRHLPMQCQVLPWTLWTGEWDLNQQFWWNGCSHFLFNNDYVLLATVKFISHAKITQMARRLTFNIF